MNDRIKENKALCNNNDELLERSNMEELLYDLSLDLVDVKKQRLSEQDLDFLCQKGYAFKLNNTFLVGRSYLRESLLKRLKYTEKIDTKLTLQSYFVSPFIVSDILNHFVMDEIALQEGCFYIPHFEKLISEETINFLCRHRIDAMTIENLTKSLGFQTKKDAGLDRWRYSRAYMHCKKVVNALVQKAVLVRDPYNSDVFYWNFEEKCDGV